MSNLITTSCQMVKNVYPGRTKKYKREIHIALGHLQTVQYMAAITVENFNYY